MKKLRFKSDNPEVNAFVENALKTAIIDGVPYDESDETEMSPEDMITFKELNEPLFNTDPEVNKRIFDFVTNIGKNK